MVEFAPTPRDGEQVRRTEHGWVWTCCCGFEARFLEDVGGHRRSCKIPESTPQPTVSPDTKSPDVVNTFPSAHLAPKHLRKRWTIRADEECPACGEQHDDACEYHGYMNGVEAERAHIVAWLREQDWPSNIRDNGQCRCGKFSWEGCETCGMKNVADAIERGEHGA